MTRGRQWLNNGGDGVSPRESLSKVSTNLSVNTKILETKVNYHLFTSTMTTASTNTNTTVYTTTSVLEEKRRPVNK
jgi:3-phenylpropionate/cinnamic acid dioxygenase small subunit